MTFSNGFNRHSRQISLALLDLSDYTGNLTLTQKKEAAEVAKQLQDACAALLEEARKEEKLAIGEVKQHFSDVRKVLEQMRDSAKNFLDSTDRQAAYEHLNEHYALVVQNLTIVLAETS